MPVSPRYITDILANSSKDFKHCVFDLMHRRLRKHNKGWQDICDRIPSDKSEIEVMDLPSLWKARKAKRLNPLFLWKFCCAYHDVVYPFFPAIGDDKRLLFGAVYTTLVHLSVLDRLVEGNPIGHIAPDKKGILPLDSAFVKDRVARFGEYVSFAKAQLERCNSDNDDGGA